jgi:cytochrome c
VRALPRRAGQGRRQRGGGRRRAGEEHGIDQDHRQLLATTLFDFIRRAMPFQQPRSLSDDEVYALTAYILALNKLIGEQDEMNAQTLPKVRMPNRDGFIPRFPEKM